MLRIYAIKDWAKHYEVSDSRKVDGPLSWVAVRTKQDGFGFRRISSERDRCELFAAWMLMVQIAARQPREDRGRLVRDGRPLTAKSLSLMTGFPEPVFERAFSFFCDPDQDWLTAEDIPTTQPASAASARAEGAPDCASRCPDESGPIRTGPEKSEPGGYTGQDRTGQDRMLVASLAASPPTASTFVLRSDHAPSPRNRKSPPPEQSDAEWLDALRADAAYRGIDVLVEHAKATRWCLENRRHLTRKRFINWLNRCDRPIAAAGCRSPNYADTEPEGWRAYWRERFPPEDFPDAPRYEDGQWSEVPNDYRRLIFDGMRRKGRQ